MKHKITTNAFCNYFIEDLYDVSLLKNYDLVVLKKVELIDSLDELTNYNCNIYLNINNINYLENYNKILKYKNIKPIVFIKFIDLLENEPKIVEFAIKNKILLFVECCKSLEELGEIDKKYNSSPIQLLEKFGYLDELTYLVGCTKLEKDDLEIINNYKSKVILTISNDLKMGLGLAPLISLINNKVDTLLGGNLNFLKELYTILVTTRGLYEDKNIINIENLLKIANKNILDNKCRQIFMEFEDDLEKSLINDNIKIISK